MKQETGIQFLGDRVQLVGDTSDLRFASAEALEAVLTAAYVAGLGASVTTRHAVARDAAGRIVGAVSRDMIEPGNGLWKLPGRKP
jgi:hypothetical protein